jgi:hypothetical protein
MLPPRFLRDRRRQAVLKGDIAAQLGACPLWVADVLGASFDRGPSMAILEPDNQVTNMTYDSIEFTRRPTPEGQGG